MLLQLDESHGDDHAKQQTMRANAKRIDSLPTRRVSKAEAKGNEGVCAICLEPMRAQQTVMSLRCKHDYHKACIMKWLKSNEVPSCPQCKAPALAEADSPVGTRESSPEQQWWHT